MLGSLAARNKDPFCKTNQSSAVCHIWLFFMWYLLYHWWQKAVPVTVCRMYNMSLPQRSRLQVDLLIFIRWCFNILLLFFSIPVSFLSPFSCGSFFLTLPFPSPASSSLSASFPFPFHLTSSFPSHWLWEKSIQFCVSV